MGAGVTATMGFAKTFGASGSAARAVTYLEVFDGVFLIIGFIVPVVAVLFIIQFVSIAIAKKMKLTQVTSILEDLHTGLIFSTCKWQ